MNGSMVVDLAKDHDSIPIYKRALGCATKVEIALH